MNRMANRILKTKPEMNGWGRSMGLFSNPLSAISFSKNLLWATGFVMVLFASCEKTIDIEVPPSTASVVIEGTIETDDYPFVIISRSEDFFAPISTSASALANSLVRDAEVFIKVDGVEHEIPKVCINDLPPEFREYAEDILGFDDIPEELDLCAYLSFDFVGEVGKTYGLRVIVDGEEYTSTTTIPQKVDLEAMWFQLQPPENAQGYIWCTLDDPDTLGNAYRMYAERIGRDDRPIAVPGASFEDRFFNGERFDFNFARGSQFGVEEDEDSAYYFKTGDLVAVKFATTDLGVYDFWETADVAFAGEGNPFAPPVQVKSNISNGARGVWAGYGVTWDTVLCVP